MSASTLCRGGLGTEDFRIAQGSDYGSERARKKRQGGSFIASKRGASEEEVVSAGCKGVCFPPCNRPLESG